MDLLKTKIPGLDEVLGGGIPRNSISYITGAPGTGKSILGVQLLVEGIKRDGEVGLYLTIEEHRDKLVEHMSAIGWDLKTMEDLRQLVIIDYPHHEVEQLVSTSNPLKEMIEDAGISRVVIDSIVPIALSFGSDYERKRAFMSLVKNMSDWDATVFVIGEDIAANPMKGIPRTKYGFESLEDGWMHMYYVRENDMRTRYLEIIKLKGMRHSNKLHRFEIEKGGIKIIP